MTAQLESPAVGWARLKRSRLLGKATLGFLVASLTTTYAQSGWHRIAGAEIASVVFSLALLVCAVMSYVFWFRRGTLPGAVTIEEQSIVVRRGSSTSTIERSRIASAYVIHRFVRGRGAFFPNVELELTGGDVVAFEVASDAIAANIVDSLGFGAGKRRAHIDFGSPARRLLHLPLAIAAYYMGSVLAVPIMLVADSRSQPGGFMGMLLGGAMVIAYSFLRAVARAPEVTIGDDGILYRAGLKKRFVPRSAITAVEQHAVGTPLVIHAGGQTISIHAAALDLERRAAATRIARERFGVTARGDGGARQFARGGRSVSEWREHLRGRVANPGYREAASPADEAAAVLSSAAATAEERAGAALALRIVGEPEQRIRVAASAAADDRLRVALETIADTEDDVAIERALKKLR